MADTWAQDIANQFKKRDNPKPISNCIGVILQIGDDWKVSIQNGAYIIDKNNGYICRHILQRGSDFTIDNESQSGSLTTGKDHTDIHCRQFFLFVALFESNDRHSVRVRE